MRGITCGFLCGLDIARPLPFSIRDGKSAGRWLVPIAPRLLRDEGLWPCGGLLVPQRNLVDTALVATSLEAGGEELVHYGLCHFVVNKSARHYEHIGIVVLARKVRYLGLPAKCGAHVLVLVEGDAYAFATAADGYAGVYLACLNAVGKGVAEIRIVATLCRVGSEVFVGVAMGAAVVDDILL